MIRSSASAVDRRTDHTPRSAAVSDPTVKCAVVEPWTCMGPVIIAQVAGDNDPLVAPRSIGAKCSTPALPGRR